MDGLTPKLPLGYDSAGGYINIDNYKDLVRQNFKMLVLTIPGERVMMPEFGVGLKKYLFEANTQKTRSNISSKIHEQVGKYLPYIEIQDLFIDSSDTNLAIEGNYIHIKIFYKIVPLSSFDVLDIEFVDT